jgi:hypothetical protein
VNISSMKSRLTRRAPDPEPHKPIGASEHRGRHLRLDELPDLIVDPNKAVLITYNTAPGNIMSGHVVVLAGYDPTKGFGFLNSGADRPISGGNILTWKSLDQMKAILQDPIGFEDAKTNPNFVIISKP